MFSSSSPCLCWLCYCYLSNKRFFCLLSHHSKVCFFFLFPVVLNISRNPLNVHVLTHLNVHAGVCHGALTACNACPFLKFYMEKCWFLYCEHPTLASFVLLLCLSHFFKTVPLTRHFVFFPCSPTSLTSRRDGCQNWMRMERWSHVFFFISYDFLSCLI